MRQPWAIITEAGLVVDDGSVIREGKLLEYARRFKALFESPENTDMEFEALIVASQKEFQGDDFRILMGTALTESGYNVINELGRILIDECDDGDDIDDGEIDLLNTPLGG